MTDIIQLIRFEDAEIRIHDFKGDRWVTVKEVAAALGYEDERNLRQLIDRNPEEFKGKQGGFKMNSPGGVQEMRVLNYRGVIRAAMKSDAPRAIKFRDWAEEVLFTVMTTGSYATSGWTPALGPRKCWSEALTPGEFLELAKLRATIWMRLAENPTSRALWHALYATFGGPQGYVDHLERVNARPMSRADLDGFCNLDPVATPEERGF